MNKKQELKGLTWKYFWEQKIEEIRKAFFFTSVALLIIAAVVFIPYLLGHFIGDNVSKVCSEEWDSQEDCDISMQWGEGVLYLAIPGLLLVFFWAWIEDNWSKAKRRAKKELKRRRRKK